MKAKKTEKRKVRVISRTPKDRLKLTPEQQAWFEDFFAWQERCKKSKRIII